MARKSRTDSRGEMLAGTLHMLVLKTLLPGPAHGHTIAQIIERSSHDVLEVEQGSLIQLSIGSSSKVSSRPSGGTSESNRKAKYYRITPAGKSHLTKERSRWETLVGAVTRVLGPATE